MNNTTLYQTNHKRSSASEFRARGREKLRGKWGVAILAAVLAGLLGASIGIASFSGVFTTSSDGPDLNVEYESLQSLLDQSPQEFFTTLFGGDVLAETGIDPFVVLAVILASVLLGLLFSLAFSLFIGSPVTLGYNRFHLALADGEKPKIESLFSFFKICFGKSVLLRLLHSLLLSVVPTVTSIVALLVGWLCLRPTMHDALAAETMREALQMLAIPALLAVLLAAFLLIAGGLLGCLISFRYAFCYMVLAEYPSLSAVDALRNSARLMQGNKWRLFCLSLSFLGWAILCVFSCGIGLLWLLPYENAAFTEFYCEIANRSAADEIEFPSLNPEDYYA